MKKNLKIAIIILAVLVIIAGLFWFWYYASFQSNFWQKFPEPLRTQTAMSRLEVSNLENLICHEDCMYERQSYRQMMADYMVKNGPESTIGLGVSSKFADGEVDIATREDMVRVLKMVEEAKAKNDSSYKLKAPQYLIDYLSAPVSDANLKSLIISEFGTDPALAKGAVNSLMEKIKNTKLGINERIPAIKNLADLAGKKVAGTEKLTTTGPIPVLKDVLDYPAICNLLMSVAEEKGDIKLRYAAVDNLYACTDFKDYYSEDIFKRLQDLLFNEENHPETQGGLVYNLKNYYVIDKEKTIAAIEKIYRDKSLSLFTMDYAAGFLKEKGINGYPGPILSQEDHNNYAQHMDEVRYYENKTY